MSQYGIDANGMPVTSSDVATGYTNPIPQSSGGTMMDPTCGPMATYDPNTKKCYSRGINPNSWDPNDPTRQFLTGDVAQPRNTTQPVPTPPTTATSGFTNTSPTPAATWNTDQYGNLFDQSGKYVGSYGKGKISGNYTPPTGSGTYTPDGTFTPTPAPPAHTRNINIAPSSPPPAPAGFQPYAGSTAPFQYTPIGQFLTPSTQTDTQNLIKQLLTGTSMNPQVVAQMKEQQKNSILSMEDQVKAQLASAYGQRPGMSSGGGLLGANSGVDLGALGQLSNAYSNIDINAAQTNRQDQLNAVNASDAFSQMLLNEFLQPAGLNLQEQQAQEQANKDSFGQWQSQEAMGQAAQTNAFQQWLQSQGLDLNYILGGQQIANFLGQ